MGASRFISRGVRFKSRVAIVSIAVSVILMIVAICVSSGFREALQDGLSDIAGDISIQSVAYSSSGVEPVRNCDTLIQAISHVDGVREVFPVVYSGGMLKNGSDVHGVVFKGAGSQLQDMDVSVPSRLASILSLSEGDEVVAYMISNRVVMRKLRVAQIYDGVVTDDDRLVVKCSLEMLRRVASYAEDEASAVEILLDQSARSVYRTEEVADAVNDILADESLTEDPLYASSLSSRYSRLFDWLGLIDLNVSIILILMTIVAAFNMVSGLLILLFQNISSIGVLKTLGMTSRQIAGSFLISSGKSVGIAMLCGDFIALALCVIQRYTHLIPLDPDSYFVSYVPVSVDFAFIAIANVLAFVAVMIVLLVPCTFIAGVQPSKSVDCR